MKCHKREGITNHIWFVRQSSSLAGVWELVVTVNGVVDVDVSVGDGVGACFVGVDVVGVGDGVGVVGDSCVGVIGSGVAGGIGGGVGGVDAGDSASAGVCGDGGVEDDDASGDGCDGGVCVGVDSVDISVSSVGIATGPCMTCLILVWQLFAYHAMRCCCTYC